MKLKQLMNFGIVVFLLFIYTANISSQTATVKGTVKDKNNYPLIGVNVVEKGTTNGTITDVDGNFTFKTEKGSIIVFSYIGFQKLEVTINRTFCFL